MEKHFIDNSLSLIVHRIDEWRMGLDFLTDDSSFIQVGTWYYNQGKELDKHYHNEFERISTLTQEAVIVMAGSLQADLYDSKNNHIKSVIIEQGDIGIFLSAGHGYKILSDNTKVIEIKNGPFFGVDKDKTRF